MAEIIGMIAIFVSGVGLGAALVRIFWDRRTYAAKKRQPMPSISKLDVFEYPSSMRPPSPSMEDGTKYSVKTEYPPSNKKKG